jgi:hypothetical protein
MLLDGVTAYLPSPLDVTNRALDVNKNQAPLELPSSQQVRLRLFFTDTSQKSYFGFALFSIISNFFVDKHHLVMLALWTRLTQG